MGAHVHLLRVFSAGPGGGNLLPVVLNAQGMSNAEMQAVAASHKHESGFVFPAPADSHYDYEFRFWVPAHEMEMCGHATIGTVWLMSKLEMLERGQVRILTKSGLIEAKVSHVPGDTDDTKDGIWVEISQPACTVMDRMEDDYINEIVSVLGVSKDDLYPGLYIQNAATSRVKTLVPLKSVSLLNSLEPQFSRIETLCEKIDSTGLYPYAVSNLKLQEFEARQFPKASGYREDAATGIAASALAFGLLMNGQVNSTDRNVKIKQGSAMGHPSEISVRFRKWGDEVNGCWIGGSAGFETAEKPL
ncbi:uncharacterized protein N7479_008952 [Penicillium vulpinum]|uniref:Phenazine biosynthesis protein n=1 Tax=Penicillium vulpinum TaxID=29845 RepID=A0A1V6R9R5_9EURO|nr:uncharacterized protein N7479_008952 [Penicillium vulpinum]KAJ5950539.1 hypothetical protein N7479_008952 [Penicillium vulpinum]OQD98275.1 hypothetical protein PENVUL_c072G01909 [Penicillium vulpinum]